VRLVSVALNSDGQGNPCREGFTEATGSCTLKQAAEDLCKLLCCAESPEERAGGFADAAVYRRVRKMGSSCRFSRSIIFIPVVEPQSPPDFERLWINMLKY